MESVPDKTLITLVKFGRASAWNQLVVRYRRLVYSIPMRMGLSSDDADDVFQNTFLSLHRQIERGDILGSLPAWLSTVARNESIATLRRRRRLTGLEESEEQATEDPMKEMEMMVDSHRALRALEGMRDKCRELLTALYVDGLSYEEVNQKLGMPLGSIGATRQRCIDTLRKLLE